MLSQFAGCEICDREAVQTTGRCLYVLPWWFPRLRAGYDAITQPLILNSRLTRPNCDYCLLRIPLKYNESSDERLDLSLWLKASLLVIQPIIKMVWSPIHIKRLNILYILSTDWVMESQIKVNIKPTTRLGLKNICDLSWTAFVCLVTFSEFQRSAMKSNFKLFVALSVVIVIFNCN